MDDDHFARATVWSAQESGDNIRAREIIERFGPPPASISNHDLTRLVGYSFYPSAGKYMTPEQEMKGEKYDPKLIKWISKCTTVIAKEYAEERQRRNDEILRQQRERHAAFMSSGGFTMEGEGLIDLDYEWWDLNVSGESFYDRFMGAEGPVGRVRITFEFLEDK